VELLTQLNQILTTDILKEGRNEESKIGHLFYLDYDVAKVLTFDAWKWRVKGVPKGAFLLAFYEGEPGEVEEALLLRVLSPTKLPTDDDITKSMIEYYKNNQDISGLAGTEKKSDLDPFTRFEFSVSGLECRILGVFYRNDSGSIEFGADVENFYSPNNYTVYKARGKVLEYIVNQGLGAFYGGEEKGLFKLGYVRYTSSRRFQDKEEKVNVWISSKDLLGKRTALFGMTRTGKSNTVKMLIKATKEISEKASLGELLEVEKKVENQELLDPFTLEGKPKFKVGQIIFDVNGEYANPNLQDEGTAIYDLYKEDVVRYSIVRKPGFKVMKVNFYREIENGFNLIKKHFLEEKENSGYMQSFLSVDLEKPDDYDEDYSVQTRYNRKVAAYLCCLFRAGFEPPKGFKVRFPGNKEINSLVRKEKPIDPSKGITLEEACIWFENAWNNYNEWDFFENYKNRKGKEYFDEDMQAILRVLTKKTKPGSKNLVNGYLKLRPLRELHTPASNRSFEQEILENLRRGKIVIIDLSQGNEEIQRLYSEKICETIFRDAMKRFTELKPNNFIQFYFEEAHNLFPKKEDKDLNQIYNRLAKEGAKLNIGMIYATQEVSSISSNILKNTQNWFIAHLNNEDEIREIRKFYDFADFSDSLLRFSPSSDKGFVRMKTYSNPFVVPIQIDKFTVKGEE